MRICKSTCTCVHIEDNDLVTIIVQGIVSMDTSTLQGVFKTPPSSPLPTEETRKSPALAISDLNYYVQYRSAPWWRGACFRKAHVKHVLNHVNLALPAGSLTALVGSSGEYYLHVNLRDNQGYRSPNVQMLFHLRQVSRFIKKHT